MKNVQSLVLLVTTLCGACGGPSSPGSAALSPTHGRSSGSRHVRSLLVSELAPIYEFQSNPGTMM